MNFKRLAICVMAIFAVTIVASCSDETGLTLPESVKMYDLVGYNCGYYDDENSANCAGTRANDFFRLTERTSLLGHLPGGQFKPDDGKAFIMFADCVDRQKRIFSRSNAGYVIQLRHAPNKHLNNRESFYGDLVALDTNMKVIHGAPEMEVTFYAAGVDSGTGEVLFQSRTATDGAPFVMTGYKECHEKNEFGIFMYAPYGNFRVTIPYKQFK